MTELLAALAIGGPVAEPKACPVTRSAPKAGCWRITGRAGRTTLSYVVKVVAE